MPYASSSARAARRLEPARSRRAPRRRSRAPRARSTVELGHRAGRAAQPRRALRGEAERAGRRLGILEAAGRPSRRRSSRPESTGLSAPRATRVRAPPRRRGGPRRRAARRARSPRRCRVGEDRPAAPASYVARVRRAEQVDRVREARLGRHHLGERRARLGARAAAASSPAPHTRRRRESRARRRSSRPRRGCRAAAAASRAETAVSSSSWSVARAARRPGGRARRRRRPSPRARPCASWPRARRRGSCRSASRGSASSGRPARRRARTCAGSRTTRGRAGSRRSRRRPPSTRAGRSTRRRPCCRSTRTPRARARARPPARAAPARARRSATRTRRGPAGSARRANVAFRRIAVEAMPRQFGPISRAPCARTSASSSSWRARPSAPVSANPAEITHSARVPAASAESAASITCVAGHADHREVDRRRRSRSIER